MTVSTLVALTVTAAAMPAVLALLRRLEALDAPGHRSSHTETTLRGGGLACVVGYGAALPFLATDSTHTRIAALVISVPFCFALLGLVDDLRDSGVQTRLAIQIVLSALGVYLLTDILIHTFLGAVLILIVVLAVTAFVNFFNFMDGINGISASSAIIVGATFAVLASRLDEQYILAASLAMAATAAAFLPFNFPRARVFLGDVGSYFFGALIALMAISLFAAGASLISVVAPLLIYIVDAGSTVLRRLMAGERWWTAHRSHVYQRLSISGLGHTRTCGIVAVFTVACACAGMLALHDSRTSVAVSLVLLALISLLYLATPRFLGHEGTGSPAEVERS